MGVRDRLTHAWNAFVNREPLRAYGDGASYGIRPDRTRFTYSSERTILSSILTRMSVDIASASIRHVRLDDQDRYVEDIDSKLNNCLKVEPNLDQGPRQFRQDMVMTLFDRGVIAVVPTDTTLSPELGSFDIETMRVGTIVAWLPSKVRVDLYNQDTGRREHVTLSKKSVAIVENPFYPVMNETNSTLQRIIRKLNLLDNADEHAGSGKLDMIIQLPYTIKTESKRTQAEQRRRDIEFQLKNSEIGVAYTDATEKVVQLNRSVENNLWNQIQDLMSLLYTQLGITKEVMDGTADEAAMINYTNRTIEPVLDAIAEAMHRAFLTKTARTQKQAVKYFRDPFKLVPVSQIAEIVDKFARNEVASSNEFRQVLGWKPSSDPKADQLRNSNMPQSELGQDAPPGEAPPTGEASGGEDDVFASVNSTIDSIFADLGVEE